MSFPNSPGVYPKLTNNAYGVSQDGVFSGAIVITSKRGSSSRYRIVTSQSEFRSIYGLPGRANPSMYAADRFLSRAGILYVRRVVVDAAAASGAVTQDANTFATLVAENEGAWGNDVKVRFEDLSAYEGEGIFRVIITENDIEVERFTVSREQDKRDGFGNAMYIEDVINGKSEYIVITEDPDVSGDYPFDTEFSLSGGSDDTTAASSGDIVNAWDDFINPDELSISTLINGGFTTAEVQVKMLTVAQTRGDCHAVLDVPQADNTDVSAMITHRQSTLNANTRWGSLYGGWLRVYDANNDIEVEIPPSGDIAAVYGYTFDNAERWVAPAGTQYGVIPNTLGVSKVFTEGERDLLYVAGVNPVTSLAGAASIVWGQKTLKIGQDPTNRVNVVNLLTWSSVRMKEALQPFVFQPNTEQNRASVNYLLTQFWSNIKNRDGVYDFAVKTDTSINTATVIANNQLMVQVFIQPTIASEFIQVETVISATGVSLSASS